MNRPMTSTSLRITEDGIEDLKDVAPVPGFSAYQSQPINLSLSISAYQSQLINLSLSTSDLCFDRQGTAQRLAAMRELTGSSADSEPT
jgi:hypothetical protein